MYLRDVQTIHRGNAAEAAVLAALDRWVRDLFEGLD
jgi:hypothetical protein